MEKWTNRKNQKVDKIGKKMRGKWKEVGETEKHRKENPQTYLNIRRLQNWSGTLKIRFLDLNPENIWLDHRLFLRVQIGPLRWKSG